MDRTHSQHSKDAIQVTHQDARSILTETRGFTSVTVPDTGFHYSLNPYRGCTFNCSYCYAAAFVFDDDARQNWGRWVAVKANAEQLLQAAGRKGKLRNKNVYMSTVTDPYQPIERKLQLTRACLQAMLLFPPRLLTVQTRSPLVVRDNDLFQRMTPGRIAVCMSITTDDEAVRRIFEPACAPIAKRLEAIRTVREAGIPTQASIAPLLPCNAERLADLLDPAVDWVVVSSFRDDGGEGRKTRQWAAELYREHGYGNYLHDGDEHVRQTTATLQRLLGPERVRVGKDGFDQVCRELGVDEPQLEQTSFLPVH
ncbi:MAG: radical SAM protein [Chloroflexota bacterium]|nr:radical SAM protein [Chloroflexota bacterium]